MAAVTASMVKELRERTGLGMMDCKKALVENDGDMEQAIDSLRKSSGMKAAKKAGRIAADGLIRIKIEGNVGVVVEINCETDFAAKDENFVTFASDVTDALFADPVCDIEALMTGGFEATRESLVQKNWGKLQCSPGNPIRRGRYLLFTYQRQDWRLGAIRGR